MLNKRFLFFVLIFSLFSISFIFAKGKNAKKTKDAEKENKTENLETLLEDENQPSWQILEWTEKSPEFVSKYEVIIEEYSAKSKKYSEVRRQETDAKTTKIQIEPLLPPGKYRFSVISYNLIGIADTQSDFYEFQIMKAQKPDVSSFSVAKTSSSTLYLDENNDGIFNISGKNLYPYTEYKIFKDKNLRQPIPFEILETDENGHHLKIKIDLKDIDIGNYFLLAKDPSGLSNSRDKRQNVNVKFKKALDFDLSVGFEPCFVLFDDTIKDYSGNNIFPLGGILRMSLLPYKKMHAYIGVGINASYSRLEGEMPLYTFEGNIITGHLNFVLQLPIRTKRKRHVMTFDIHAGPGLTALIDTKLAFKKKTSEPLKSINFSVDAGIAAQIYITRRLYAELNCDFIFPIMSDIQMGMLKPSVGVGWQF